MPQIADLVAAVSAFEAELVHPLDDAAAVEGGEGGSFVEGGRLRFDSSSRLALNTDGGGLSSNHPGMRGIFLLIEAARQLRGQSCSQVPDAKLAVAHGNGGMLGTRHAASTIILGRD